MRDQHRPKQDLINEVVALRKQVSDLKEAGAERRRVEEALRHAEEQLRVLVNCAPVGLCLLDPQGTPILANLPLARTLGYDSPSELLNVSTVLGLFASPAHQHGVLASWRKDQHWTGEVLLRRKDGSHHAAWVLPAVCPDPAAVALVVLERRMTRPESSGTLNFASTGGIPGE